MRIVYVGDNRNRGNFGCRGTSTALSQIISEKHEIVGRITGKYTNHDTGELFFKRGIPSWCYRLLPKLYMWEYLRKLIYLYHRFRGRGGKYLFSKYDFISLDFDKSISNLIKCLPANPFLSELDLRRYDFDALVVNGEGSFIFATPPWRESLVEAMEMYWAKKLGKKVYYLNGMLSDDPLTPHNAKTIEAMQSIFELCDSICVREYQSLDYLNKYFPNTKALVFPDALFSWYDLINDDHSVTNGRYYIPHSAECDEAYYEYDFSSPYICVSGSSSIIGVCNGDMKTAIDAYTNLTNAIKDRFQMNVYLIEVCEGDYFLNYVSKNCGCPIVNIETPLVSSAKILANAVLYVSGRYHPSIMASLGGTPSVYLTSNSHKTRSIQQLLEYKTVEEFPVIPDNNDIERILDRASELVCLGKSERARIRERARELSIIAKGISAVIE